LRAAGVAASLLGGLALAGCGGERIEGPDRHVPEGSTVIYDCDDGKALQATFQGVESVTIDFQGKQYQLRSVLSEKGAKYKAGNDIFQVEGDTAALESDAGSTRCIVRP
jgi:membrane-bound inhibitor of C-type lysozyme